MYTVIPPFSYEKDDLFLFVSVLLLAPKLNIQKTWSYDRWPKISLWISVLWSFARNVFPGRAAGAPDWYYLLALLTWTSNEKAPKGPESGSQLMSRRSLSFKFEFNCGLNFTDNLEYVIILKCHFVKTVIFIFSVSETIFHIEYSISLLCIKTSVSRLCMYLVFFEVLLWPIYLISVDNLFQSTNKLSLCEFWYHFMSLCNVIYMSSLSVFM